MAPLETGDLQEFKGLLAVDEPPVLPVWGARWRVFPCARERDKLGLQSHGSKRKRLLGKRTERAPADKFKVCKQVAQAVRVQLAGHAGTYMPYLPTWYIPTAGLGARSGEAG